MPETDQSACVNCVKLRDAAMNLALFAATCQSMNEVSWLEILASHLNNTMRAIGDVSIYQVIGVAIERLDL